MSFPPYESYKDSGTDWLGNVPVHWGVKRLDHYFNERREKVSDKDFQALSVTKNGIMLQLETAAKTDDGDNRKKVLAGDFVINSRSDRKGSSGVSPFDGSVSLINTILQPRESVNSEFIHYLLRSQPFQEEFYRYGKGIVADLWSTNYSEMRNIVLAVPPLAEQRAIAAFLERETARLDTLITKQERLIELSLEKRRALISHAVKRGLDANAPLKDSGVEWLGPVPQHWEVKKLKYLCRVQTGDKDTVNAVEDGAYPFFVRSQTVERINTFTYDCEAILTAGDGAGVGKVFHHYIGPFDFHQRVYMLNDFQEVSGRFLFLFLKENFYRVALDGNAKSTVDSLRMPVFLDFRITVPPLPEQHAVVEHLDVETQKIDTLIDRARRAIELMREHRTSLIAAAVTGKIDVRGHVAIEEITQAA
jgi:type I restriction enzyme, S subunit